MTDARSRLLDAALPLVLERGPHAVTLAEIAASAQVPVGDAAVLFATPEALANELYRSWKGELARAILGEFPIAAEPREQFRVFWYRACDFGRQLPHVTAFLRRASHASWLDEQSRTLEDQVHGLLVGALARWRAERRVRDESPELLGGLVLGAYDGVFESCRRGYFVFTDEVAASSERMIWDAIRG
ncbi:MAG: TetR family transcriptional regulator [Myxococcota bacterium]